MRSAAAEGIRTPAVTLPFLDRIQASFGRHSISHVKAHVGSKSARAARAMNALAFARGNHVVFCNTPDLRTAAHEAAHVVQQQAGVQLAGGIGRKGDAYERHADAVADAVVAGRLAEDLLKPFAVLPKVKQNTMMSLEPRPTTSFIISPPAAAPLSQIQRLPVRHTNPIASGLVNGTHLDRRDLQPGFPQVPAHVTAVMKNAPDGGPPSVSPPGWTWLQNRLGRVKGQWVRFHIINQGLGGRGSDVHNLVPTTVAVNNDFSRNIEQGAKQNANNQGEWTYVEVVLTYNPNWPVKIPSRIDAEWGSWDIPNAQWQARANRTLHNQDITQFNSKLSYLRGNNITQDQLKKRGVPSRGLVDFTDWLKRYHRTSDNDIAFLNEADRSFPGLDLDAVGWFKEVWLDEDDTRPGTFIPVLKAL